MNIVNDNLIRVRFNEGETTLSLPAVFAGLVANRIDSFPALRALFCASLAQWPCIELG
jgi:hypothetical protein